MRWLSQLPKIVSDLALRWNLTLATPFEEDLTGAWVAPCMSPDGPSVLKVGFPHFEADHEIDGLRLINGRCAVHLFNGDNELHALQLERCSPGAHLRGEDEEYQRKIICQILQELWQIPPNPSIRPLEVMVKRWSASARDRFSNITEHRDIILKGLDTLESLADDKVTNTLLATDLHAGNVLSSTRRPWLMIDPKPHVGDPCYDLTQHFLNVQSRLDLALIESMSRSAEVDAERVLRWTFGRLCLDQENHALAVQLSKLL